MWDADLFHLYEGAPPLCPFVSKMKTNRNCRSYDLYKTIELNMLSHGPLWLHFVAKQEGVNETKVRFAKIDVPIKWQKLE